MATRFPTEAELTKRRLLNDLLQDGMVTIQLDPRRTGVDVPEGHKSEPALTLNLSLAFNLDVFEIGPYSVIANLSFGGTRHRCVIPYQAIYVIVSQAQGKHLLFPEDVPIELEAQFPITDHADEGSEHVEEPRDPMPSPQLVESSEPDDDDDGDDDPPRPPAGSHLRLVK
jgi:stringent starvation protein B